MRVKLEPWRASLGPCFFNRADLHWVVSLLPTVGGSLSRRMKWHWPFCKRTWKQCRTRKATSWIAIVILLTVSVANNVFASWLETPLAGLIPGRCAPNVPAVNLRTATKLIRTTRKLKLQPTPHMNLNVGAFSTASEAKRSLIRARWTVTVKSAIANATANASVVCPPN